MIGKKKPPEKPEKKDELDVVGRREFLPRSLVGRSALFVPVPQLLGQEDMFECIPSSLLELCFFSSFLLTLID